MNRPLLTGVLLIALYSPAVSQPDPDFEAKRYLRHQIDSLQNEINTTKEDTILVRNLCLLSDHYSDFDSALIYSRRAVQLAEKLKYPYGIAMGLLSLGSAFYLHRDFESSNYYLRKGLDLSIAHSFYFKELNEFRQQLNNNFFLKGDYTNATDISTGGLATAERINDSANMAHYNNVLGYIMMKLRNFKASEQYFSVYLKLTQQLKDSSLEAHAWLDLADLSVAENKIAGAIPFINNALNIYQAHKTEHYYSSIGRQAYTYNKLAEVYKLMQKNVVALQYNLRAIEFVQKPVSVNHYDKAAFFINAGDIYNRLMKPDSALVYLRQGLAIAERIKHREIMQDAYEQFSLSFGILKKFDSAYIYQLVFSKLKDSILNETSPIDILQRDADLQIEKQRRIEEAKIDRQRLWRNIIIGVFIFILLMVVMFYNRYRIKQRIAYQQQLNEQQNEMFNLTASVEERERKRIAEDLHDGLGSVLSAAKLKLSSLDEDKGSLTDEQKTKYQATLSLLDEAAAELRNISHNIMPATLSKLGLIAALKNITDRVSSHSGLQVQLETHGFDKRLEESAEISIYRIVLELINNIVKHAQATKAVVQLIKYPDYINITVEDNGKGFDYKEALNQSKGIGLGNIESRVNYLKGTIDVDSLPGRGTVTIIDIPFSAELLKYQDVGIKND